MCQQKVIRIKKIFFVCILKVTDEKSRIRIRNLVYGSKDPYPDPYHGFGTLLGTGNRISINRHHCWAELLLFWNKKFLMTFHLIKEDCLQDRFDKYLDPNFFQHRIHWFSIFNSFMMVIFLVGHYFEMARLAGILHFRLDFPRCVCIINQNPIYHLYFFLLVHFSYIPYCKVYGQYTWVYVHMFFSDKEGGGGQYYLDRYLHGQSEFC